jgi:hypothetical protein
MFGSKGRKRNKITEAILAELQPLVFDIERQTGKKLNSIRKDPYTLGFLAGMTSYTTMRLDQNLDQGDRGLILFAVIERLYGPHQVGPTELINYLQGIPLPNAEFKKGFENSAKLQLLLYTTKKPEGDPDYESALAAVRGRAGHQMNRFTPGATEDGNVTGLLMAQWFYQPVMKKLGLDV